MIIDRLDCELLHFLDQSVLTLLLWQCTILLCYCKYMRNRVFLLFHYLSFLFYFLPKQLVLLMFEHIDMTCEKKKWRVKCFRRTNKFRTLGQHGAVDIGTQVRASWHNEISTCFLSWETMLLQTQQQQVLHKSWTNKPDDRWHFHAQCSIPTPMIRVFKAPNCLLCDWKSDHTFIRASIS